MLPWLVAAAGLAVYLVTLHPWVSFDSLSVVGRVAGWEWNPLQLGPVTLLVTWPIRWLPEPWQVPALNLLSAACAAAVLGLLAKCVALLPHDRTREQRQRERSDFSFLTTALAWAPPAAAAALLAFQLTFWEHATAQTGEMLNLLLFALCIYCFLRFRVMQEDSYLAVLSFVFGAAAANDWGMVGFTPLFFVAILWAKGIAFFEAKFLIRTTLAGLAGALLYLLPPIVLKVSGQGEGTYFEILRASLGFQRQMMFSFPRWALLFCGVGSILPVFFMGIRWPSTFGDMSAAGSALTNALFRVIHLAFLGFCAWLMFDPPFSPREMGFGLPFLRFYFLTALSVGYMAGYLILVLSEEAARKAKPVSEAMAALGRLAGTLTALALLAAAGALAWHNFPTIRGQNSTLTRTLAESLVPKTTSPTALLSDDPSLLALAVGRARSESGRPTTVAVQTDLLRHHVYQRRQEKIYGGHWPALALDTLSNPLGDDILLQQVAALTASNRLYYLHPSFGFFFEAFHLVPAGSVFTLERQAKGSLEAAPPPDDAFSASHQYWEAVVKQFVDEGELERLRDRRVTDAEWAGRHLSRGVNTWGVELQRRQRLEEAGRFFTAAQRLNKENLAAIINARYNEQLRQGRRDAIVLDKELDDQLGRYRDLPTFLLACGPVDEPGFCFRLGRVYSAGGLHRQAAQQFARSLQLQPDFIDARLWLASAGLSAQLFDVVSREVGELSQVKSRLTPAQQVDLAGMEAWSQFRAGKLDQAVQVLQQVQKDFPDRTESLQMLGDIYLAASQTNSALEVIQKLVEKKPGDAGPMITKSAIQMQMGALGPAVETLSSILERDPRYFPALVNRALAYTRLQQFDDAEKDYLRLLEIAPQMAIVYYHLGEIDFQRRDAAGARRHYREFLERTPSGTPEARTAQQRLDEIAAGKLGG